MTHQVRFFWGVLAITAAGACSEAPAGMGGTGGMVGTGGTGGMTGPPVAPGPTFASGTRYLVRTLRAPGTDPLMVSLLDQQRGVDCVPLQDGAGPVRCASPDSVGKFGVDHGPAMEGQRRAVAFGDRLSRTEMLTPDGARFPVVGSSSFQLEDARWNGPCHIAQAAGGDAHCLPDYAAGIYYFADAGCTELLVQPIVQLLGTEPRIAIVDHVPRELGARFIGPVHIGLNNTCYPMPFVDENPRWRHGPPLPADAVVRLQLGTRGQDRLRLVVLQLSPEQVVIPARNPRIPGAAAYFDSQGNQQCTPRRTPAGVRCLAGVEFVPPGELRYMDVGCTRPVLSRLASEVALEAADDGHPVPRVTELYGLGEWYGSGSGAVVDVYRREGGVCQLRPEKNTFRPLTAAGDWDRFAPLEEWLGDSRL